MKDAAAWEEELAVLAQEESSLEVFCRCHPLAVLRPVLAASGVQTAASLRQTPAGRLVRVAGLMLMVHTPPTRSGRRVMFVTLEDETGLVDLVAFAEAQARWARLLLMSRVVTVEGRLGREGRDGLSLSVQVARLLPQWCGPLAVVARRCRYRLAARRWQTRAG
ncbi:MAG: OB-fold nucleic acid binding domain-containing protein [Thermodesulfobacteriota bacterium]